LPTKIFFTHRPCIELSEVQARFVDLAGRAGLS
jgi:hypothetical protein